MPTSGSTPPSANTSDGSRASEGGPSWIDEESWYCEFNAFPTGTWLSIGCLAAICLSLAQTCSNADCQTIAPLPAPAGCEVSEGVVVRGPKQDRRLALVFTGHEFAEGGQTILDELAKHKATASFFLTGDFLANPRIQTSCPANRGRRPFSRSAF